MFNRRFFAEAATLVILAAICGTVANVVAARDRKLAFAGNYPNALTVPQKVTAPEPPAADPVIDPAPAADTETAAADTAPMVDATTDATPAVAPATATTETAPTVATTTTHAPQVVEKPAPTPVRQFAPTPDKVSEDITNAEARSLFEQGALFLDARRTGAYQEGHIPGAKSFAVWEADVDDKVNNLFYEQSDQQKPIVVYCTGGNCEDSHMLAQKLWGIGYETVLVYTDGFPGWLSIGGAVER